MYAQKHSGRATAGRQSSDVLLRALAERHPDLGDHLDGVAELAEAVGERLGHRGRGARAAAPRRRAARHRQGRDPRRDHHQARPAERRGVGVHAPPHASSASASSPPRRRSAPAARLVRSSHEAWDGSGYPDALAGAEIPLGARIIAVCDAFDAMISDRPYAPARRPSTRRSPSCAAAPARSSTPPSSRPSRRSSPSARSAGRRLRTPSRSSPSSSAAPCPRARSGGRPAPRACA